MRLNHHFSHLLVPSSVFFFVFCFFVFTQIRCSRSYSLRFLLLEREVEFKRLNKESIENKARREGIAHSGKIRKCDLKYGVQSCNSLKTMLSFKVMVSFKFIVLLSLRFSKLKSQI